jgi:hypothetical protein
MTMRMWGEHWSHSEAGFGNMESRLGRSVAYVRTRPVTRADGSQVPWGNERCVACSETSKCIHPCDPIFIIHFKSGLIPRTHRLCIIVEVPRCPKVDYLTRSGLIPRTHRLCIIVEVPRCLKVDYLTRSAGTVLEVSDERNGWKAYVQWQHCVFHAIILYLHSI